MADSIKKTLNDLLFNIHNSWSAEDLKLELVCPRGERGPSVYVTANHANWDGSPNAMTVERLQIQGEVDGVSILCTGARVADVIDSWNRAASR